MPMQPLVIDISRYQTVTSFERVYAAGIRGVILKATQGTRYVDPRFKTWLPQARRAGLLVGSYHFGTSAPVDDQVAHFLKTVDWEHNPDLMLALDFERNDPNPRDTMNVAQAKRFLQLVADETGQRPVLYSGAWIKQWMPRAGDPFFNSHRLWLAQYSERYKMPPGWEAPPFLHQYSGDGSGPGPHDVDGVRNESGKPGIDMNAYYGRDLAAEWIERVRPVEAPPSPPVVAVALPTPSAPAPEPVVFTSASDGDAPPKKAVLPTIGEATSHASAMNELADAGSRLASTFQRCFSSFWRVVFGGTATAGVASTLVDPNQGSAAVVNSWASQHPFLLCGLVVGVMLVLGYVGLFILRKYFLTAVADGRYAPRGGA